MDQDSLKCDVPPFGWFCTREKGHDGPCAAYPNTPLHYTIMVQCPDCGADLSLTSSYALPMDIKVNFCKHSV